MALCLARGDNVNVIRNPADDAFLRVCTGIQPIAGQRRAVPRQHAALAGNDDRCTAAKGDVVKHTAHILAGLDGPAQPCFVCVVPFAGNGHAEMEGFAGVLPMLLKLHLVEEALKEVVDCLRRAEGRIKRRCILDPAPLSFDIGIVVIQTTKLPGHFIQAPFGHFVDVLQIVNARLNGAAHDLQGPLNGLCHGVAVLVGQNEVGEKLMNRKVDHVAITASVILPLQWAFSAMVVYCTAPLLKWLPSPHTTRIAPAW